MERTRSINQCLMGGWIDREDALESPSFAGAPADPLGVLHDAPPYDHAKLETSHMALLEAIAPLLEAHGVAPTELSPPSQLVVGVWSRPGVIKGDHGYTAPTKVYWAPEISALLF